MSHAGTQEVHRSKRQVKEQRIGHRSDFKRTVGFAQGLPKPIQVVFDPDAGPLGPDTGGGEVVVVLLAADFAGEVFEAPKSVSQGEAVALPIAGGHGEIDERAMLGFELRELLKITFDIVAKAEPFRDHSSVLEDFVAQPVFAGEGFLVGEREGLARAGKVIEGALGDGVLDGGLNDLLEAHRGIVPNVTTVARAFARTTAGKCIHPA